MNPEAASEMVAKWRADNPRLANLWKKCELASRSATPNTAFKTTMESMTTTEIIDRINEIEAVQDKHLPVRCESPAQFVYNDEYVNCDIDEAVFSVVDVKYRAGSHNRLPYIALICR